MKQPQTLVDFAVNDSTVSTVAEGAVDLVADTDYCRLRGHWLYR